MLWKSRRHCQKNNSTVDLIWSILVVWNSQLVEQILYWIRTECFLLDCRWEVTGQKHHKTTRRVLKISGVVCSVGAAQPSRHHSRTDWELPQVRRPTLATLVTVTLLSPPLLSLHTVSLLTEQHASVSAVREIFDQFPSYALLYDIPREVKTQHENQQPTGTFVNYLTRSALHISYLSKKISLTQEEVSNMFFKHLQKIFSGREKSNKFSVSYLLRFFHFILESWQI